MHSNLQQIHDIAAVCAQKGIKRVVLSPGSRCAPITVSFARHPEVETFVVPDERSAAFIALGMALETKTTVAIVCTSGTAAVNYYPAITEAYYQQIPLLVITADRPPELIDQGDGQTIRQENLYANHIKQSFSFPIDAKLESAHQLLADAIDLTQALPQGPVHVNVPIREPFYPEKNETLNFSPFTLNQTKKEPLHTPPLPDLTVFKNVLIVVGQAELSQEINNRLHSCEVPIICESISNLAELKHGVNTHDLFLSKLSDEEQKHLQPDLLISLGDAILSKSLKQFLRANKPKAHWNFSNTETPVDVFQSISHSFPSEQLNQLDFKSLTSEVTKDWLTHNENAKTHLKTTLETTDWNEFTAIQQVVQGLPKVCNLHVANSMSIRYVNYLTFLLNENQIVRSNRGTSGIDGSVSTAVGCAITSPDKLNILITGDLAFFYDRNGLWHNHLPKNLRIILMNNHGGGIFRMIDGPANLPEHETYFETPQHLNGKNTANDFNLGYSSCTNHSELNNALNVVMQPLTNSHLLEITTNTVHNTVFFKQLKQTYNTKTND